MEMKIGIILIINLITFVWFNIKGIGSLFDSIVSLVENKISERLLKKNDLNPIILVGFQDLYHLEQWTAARAHTLNIYLSLFKQINRRKRVAKQNI